ncbi:protein mono-ADP-ribosyltransferase PARP14-like [Branchiostoma floridae]|uniref:E3 ubiquitin-protein ligase n=1 Tax=Branchiostoma floridae TaxID=7739 RepID=A0A9J7LJ88_BRAFL|nr:protein mono-ADP-ribosyltransferase PARP14-like [Branchiostoma floridae]
MSKPEDESHEDGWQMKGVSATMATVTTLTCMPSNTEDDKEVSNAHTPKVSKKTAHAPLGANGKEKVASETDLKLDAVKVEFLQKVHKKSFDYICTSNNVVIVVEAEPSSCKVIFRENAPGKGDVGEASQQFLELYQRISDELSKNNILNVLEELPECTIQCLKDALCHAESNERVLVKNCLSDDFKIVFYGSEQDVEQAIATFVRRSRQQTTGPDRGKTADYTSFKRTVSDIEVSVYKGDITQQKADVVVNAANKKLEHMGGVAFAISKAGGKSIQEESRAYVRRHGTLHIGQAVHTGAGNMPCRFVVHTVGPMWDKRGDNGTARLQLREAITNVLYYACDKLQARSIAIPAISAGIYGVPVDVSAEQLMLATQKFVRSPPSNNTLRHIKFVNIEDKVNRVFVRVFSDNLQTVVTEGQSPEVSGYKDCPICLEKTERPKRLHCCGNEFCSDCIEQAFNSKPVCPTCGKQYGALKGSQPRQGRMEVQESPESLPGYPECGLIKIRYLIPNGIQEQCHPNPGRPYQGTDRLAYLPNNKEGRDVLELLKRAFDNRLVFTVGTSASTGRSDVVTWNDIHHKTSIDGSYGYPDPDYLRRVKEELAAKGIRSNQHPIYHIGEVETIDKTSRQNKEDISNLAEPDTLGRSHTYTHDDDIVDEQSKRFISLNL